MRTEGRLDSVSSVWRKPKLEFEVLPGSVVIFIPTIFCYKDILFSKYIHIYIFVYIKYILYIYIFILELTTVRVQEKIAWCVYPVFVSQWESDWLIISKWMASSDQVIK